MTRVRIVRCQLERTCILLFMATWLVACTPSPEPGTEWIIGRWQLTHNPDQDDNDILIFKPGGKLEIDTESGQTIAAHYLIREEEVLIVFVNRGDPIETSFRIHPDRTQLIFHNGAIYSKQ